MSHSTTLFSREARFMSSDDSNRFPRPSGIIDPQTGQPSPLLDERPWLQTRSREELIEYIIELANELRARPATSTATNIPIIMPQVDEAETTIEIDPSAREFLRIPNRPSEVQHKPFAWRIILRRLDGHHLPIALEITDDVVIGRWSEAVDLDLDLDLNPLGAAELGVSRLHCVLRPSQRSLMLFDLGSSNGTSVNGALCTNDRPQRVEDNAVIRLGAMFLRVLIVDRP
jgi:hypothetical protein